MSTPEAGERLAGETATRRAPRVTKMLVWAGVDGLRLEAARVVLGERSLQANGSLVSTPQEGVEPYFASYSLTTDDAGVTQRLAVRATRVRGEQYVTLTRSEEGIWLVDHVADHGARTVRTNFGGAVDVDLVPSPLFNALPVRRLGLHRTAVEQDLPTVFVSLPGLEVGFLRQIYRTVAVGEATVVSVASDLLEAVLTVDSDGLVLEYPGLARRA